MKKKYIRPTANAVYLEPLCFETTSVYEKDLSGKKIDSFQVIEQEQTKTDTKYSSLWGESNKSNWGDD